MNVEQFLLLLFLQIIERTQANIVRLERFNNGVESRLLMKERKNCYLNIFGHLNLIGIGFFFVFLNSVEL